MRKLVETAVRNTTFWRLAALLGVLTALGVGFAKNAPQKPAKAKPLTSDPIIAIGHGAIVGADGKNINLTAPFIETSPPPGAAVGRRRQAHGHASALQGEVRDRRRARG